MASRAKLRGAYLLLNHKDVTLDKLSKPHWEKTRGKAGQQGVVLFLQDTTELDYTYHNHKTGLGPIGDGRGRGLLLHTTLAAIPTDAPQILGLAHQKAVLRREPEKPRPKYTKSPESLVWTDAAKAVGRAPEGVQWVHVGDGASDDFRFMNQCRELGKDFLVRVTRNRILEWNGAQAEGDKRKLRDFSKMAEATHRYEARLPARAKRRGRTAQLSLSWAKVILPAPPQGPSDIREKASITAWVLHIWEENSEGEDGVEWFLLTSVPTETKDEAMIRVRWYLLRWQTEEYHKCLKTGCSVEKSQLNDADDIRRLLGFLGPVAARLLQLRNLSRAEPETPASQAVDETTLAMLAARLMWPKDKEITMGVFWKGVAQLGGHQGRRGDGPPGWITIWRGWKYLQDLVEGARIIATLNTPRPSEGH
jgi:hypothetical protein